MHDFQEQCQVHGQRSKIWRVENKLYGSWFGAIKQTDVSFSCVYPVIDHEFRHNIVKVAVDPRGDSRVDPQTTGL